MPGVGRYHGTIVGEWANDGLCRQHPEVDFFPSDIEGVWVCQAICAECPVAEPCAAHAIEHREEFGIWGGLSERARRRYWSAQREEAKAG